jgi:GAF domain-containing protein
MSTDTNRDAKARPDGRERRDDALTSLTMSAVANIPHVDFASITLHRQRTAFRTVAATDPLAERMDTLQYELGEGPCYAAVTDERVVLVNDMTSSDYGRYAPRAADLGVGAQAAIQLVSDGERAGLNLYARRRNAFDRSTIEFAELFATQAAAILGYVEQLEQLSEALHTRSDIGTAVGILMERYKIDHQRAFAVLVRISNTRNLKLRLLARQLIDGTLESTTVEGDSRPR